MLMAGLNRACVGICKYCGENNGILIENTLEVWKITL